MTQPSTIALSARAAYEAAKAAYKASRTPENMEAVRAAWAAYDAATPLRKASGFACRAGQRQARERRGR